MRARILASILTTALTLATASEAATVMEPTSVTFATGDSQVVRVDFGDRLNRARDRAGVSNVRTSRNLRRAARNHAEDMMDRGYFAHTSPDGSDPMDRARRAGCNCYAIAENIAAGQQTAGEVFRAWMGSPGHRENMLRDGYRRFGLARVDNVWVLMLSD